MKSIILGALLTFLTLAPVHSNVIFSCTLSGNTCTFNNVVLNEIQYEWKPTSTGYSSAVLKLIFKNCNIPVVTRGICETFPFINALDMSGIGVKQVREDAFFGCKHLEHLDLRMNSIETLAKQTFTYNTEMKRLILYDNKFTSFGDGTFARMVKLEQLGVGINNLTSFPPDLIEYNKNLKNLQMDSNDMLDVEAERIVELLPRLEKFELDDNEISCSRMSQIIEFFKKKGLNFGIGHQRKTRYYATDKIFAGQRCVPEVSSMAANYRKDYSKVDQKLHMIETKQTSSGFVQQMVLEKLEKIEKILLKMQEWKDG